MLPALQSCLQQLAVALSPSAAPLGIPATAFWMYVCASLLVIIGAVRISFELPQERGIDKVMPAGRLFFAIPMGVFATEHFTTTAAMAKAVPRWIPAHTFWVLLVGVGFLCAAVSIAIRVQARLAAALVGTTFVIFVLVIDLPSVIANPHNRFFWALALRELAFSGGAFAFAMSSPSGTPHKLLFFPRLFVGVPSVFYGVEHLLHPEHVPGIPLKALTPEWIYGRIVLSYAVGVILIVAGLLLLRNIRAAATFLGLTILLTVLWVYLPILAAAPTDLVALNYFFDTLLFCGTILLLANAMARGAAVVTAGEVGLVADTGH